MGFVKSDNKMDDFKTRLTKEREELAERTKKLEDFMVSDKSNEIDQFQLAFLGIQLLAMKTYLRCLDERWGRL